MRISRYSNILNNKNAIMSPCKDGKWVRHTRYIAAMERKDRKLLNANTVIKKLSSICKGQYLEHAIYKGVLVVMSWTWFIREVINNGWL